MIEKIKGEIMKIGRNDPCPCGSGKKYKKCCLALESDRGVPEEMHDLMADIRHKIEDNEFGSLDEVNRELDKLMAKKNQEPMTEFHGLSPEQMYQVLHFPFDSPEIVRFDDGGELVLDTPIIRLFSFFVEALGEKGLKLTKKGNLPPKFCREAALFLWGAEQYAQKTKFHSIRTEVDFFEMHILRIVAKQAGLIRNYKGRVVLIKKVLKKITSAGVGSCYPDLFKTYVQKFNWEYIDGFDGLPFLQESFLFTLYLLQKYGGSVRQQTFYADIFVKAFPQLMGEIVETPYCIPEERLVLVYCHRTFKYFATFLGFISYHSISESLFDRKYEVKKLPLLDQFLSFNV